MQNMELVQESQRHRMQCGPLHINFGGSPEQPSAGVLPLGSAPGMRARGGQRRSACFGFAEADDEEATRSAAEQRYLKARPHISYCLMCNAADPLL